MGLSVSHSLSATTPNDPAFEIQPKHWNSGHIYTLNAVGSEISGAFGNGGGITFGLSADGNITAAAPAAGASINFSGGTTSQNLTQLKFADSNGISFGLGTGASSISLTATVKTDYLTTAMASNRGSDFIQATAGFNGTNNSGTIASNSISVSGLNQAVSAANGSYAFQTISFSNANGVSFGTSAGSAVTASHNALTSQSTQFLAMTLGGNTAGTTTFNATNNASLFFNGGNGITLSGNGSTVTISGVTQSNQTVGFYATGNTTHNSSTTFDARTAGSWNALGAATIGFSNGSVEVSVPATSSLVGTSGVSMSTNGSTISVYPVPLSDWDPYPILSGTATSSHAPASVWFSRMILDWPIAVSYANVLKSMNVSAPGASSQNSSLTNKWSYGHSITIFTRQDFGANSSRMSTWTSASFGMTGSLSQSSSSASVALSWVTNSTGGTTSFSTTSGSNLWTNFFTGLQMFRIPLVTTMTPGEYFIAQQQSTTTATVGSNFTLLSVSNLHIAPQSLTLATVTSSGSLGMSSPEGLGIGVASAVTTNNTMAITVISAATQNWWYMNFSNV